MQRGRNRMATQRAEGFLRDRGIDRLPIDPIKIAEELGIIVQAKPDTARGVSGMLLRHGDRFGIMYATHIDSEGFKRFSVAHELAHYLLEGHIDHLFPTGESMHSSHAGFVSADPYELEADYFAAGLLMPDPLFSRELRRHGDGREAIEAMANLCVTSLTATAIRYVEKATVPVAVVVSTDEAIDYAFMSDALKAFDNLSWPRKGQALPAGSETMGFNQDPKNVRAARRAEADTDLQDWFGGRLSVLASEEIIGLGRYGKTLTVIAAAEFADEADDDRELEENWIPRFRR